MTEEKFRVLKKSNDKIAKLTSIQEVHAVLTYGGFERSNEGYYLAKINLSLLDECINELSKHGHKITFNPYEQKIISLSANKVNYEGETSVVFNEMLAE